MSKARRAPIKHCTECPIGIASGEGRGQFCPFVPSEVPAGTVVFREHELAHHVYFVREGAVTLSRGGTAPRCEHEIGPGRYVGTEAMIPQQIRYRHTGTASGPATLCSASVAGVDQWLGPADSPARTSLSLVLDDLDCC